MSNDSLPQDTLNADSVNRNAFLLGVYAALSAVDGIVEPLVRLSGILSIPKIILLDATLARVGQYDAEHAILGNFEYQADVACQLRRKTLHFLLSMERSKLQTIAAQLWNSGSEHAAWYQAGRAIGNLLEACGTRPDDGLPSLDQTSTARSALAQAVDLTGIARLGDLVANFNGWIGQLEDLIRERNQKMRPSALPAAAAQRVAVKPGFDVQQLRKVERLAQLIEDRLRDTTTDEQRCREDRDEFLYTSMAAGMNARQVRQIIKTEHKAWLPLPTDLREAAQNYADRTGRPPLPPARRGRPPSRPAE